MALTFLCLANYVKGEPFLRQCREMGVKTVVVTLEKLQDEEWPDCIDEIFYISDLGRRDDLLLAVSYLARSRAIDAVVPLDDYAVETAASLREHLRCPGMGESTARYFRDKLAMRMRAKEAGLPVPEFVHVLNYEKVGRYLDEVPGPWLLKPRSEAGSVQIRKLQHPDELWQAVNELGDRQSFFLLESYVPGDVFHVDSIVWDNQVVFSSQHRYGRPPFNVWNEGGIFWSESVDPSSSLAERLAEANQLAIEAMGLVRGVTHAEFILGRSDDRLYFLELAARTGGAHIDVLVEQEGGLNLWREWARLEAAYSNGKDYVVEPSSHYLGGLLLCLSRQQEPDLSGYDAPEVCWRLEENYHAGLIMTSDDLDRVRELMGSYCHRLSEEVLAVAPPTSKPA